MSKEKKEKLLVGSNNEPLGKEGGEISCQHIDKLPQTNEVLKTTEESHAHDKTTNVPGIHEGKRPKFVNHPEVENVA